MIYEKNILSEVLVWQKLLSQSEATLLSYQHGQGIFQTVSEYFQVSEFPTLIVSDKPDMKPNVKLKSNALLEITKAEDGLRKLLVNIHVQLKADRPIESIKGQITRQDFWNWMKWGYNEFKQFITFID